MNPSSTLRRGLAAAWLAPALACAAPDFSGRWEGEADIPGAPLPLVIDLAPATSPGWLGSVTLPGRGVKGAPLDKPVTDGTQLRFGLGAAFGIPADPAPAMALRPGPDGSLVGELQQAGHSARVSLRRSGPPQVDLPVPATPIGDALAGTWTGRYELGGYPRDVTVTLAKDQPGQLVIVGKRTTTLPIDHVVQGREFVTLQARSAGLRIEGRLGADSIQGQFVQGPFEAPLVLRRTTKEVKP